MQVKETEIVEKATEFENRKHVYKSTNEKIVAMNDISDINGERIMIRFD